MTTRSIGRLRLVSLATAVGAVGGLLADPVGAHTGERVFLQLLPTGRYLTGGAIVVALTFALMAWLPVEQLRRMADARWRLHTITTPSWPGVVMLVLLVGLVTAGWTGSRDPLDNPLPTIVWSLWWVGFTLLHALLGNLWRGLSPWPALHSLLTAAPALRWLRRRPPLAYPPWLAHWPAVLGLAAFAWLELVYPAPQDPARLAAVVSAYTAVTALAMLVFGRDAWLRHGETFSVFFTMVARLAPLQWGTKPAAPPATARQSGAELSAETTEPPDSPVPARTACAIQLRFPGAGLRHGPAPGTSMTVFILLALATVSFDGLSRTFWFVDMAGHNPLEYPGRSTLLFANSTGMLVAFAALAGGYALAVLLGLRLAAIPVAPGVALRSLVVSIIPIALGYHAAHYLPYLLIDTQYALRAMGDPFALGWNLGGLRDLHVRAAFLSDHASVERIWNAQVFVIVGAHVMAVAVAHMTAADLGHERRRTLLSQLPLTVLMIGYTLFGLWLLSTVAVG